MVKTSRGTIDSFFTKKPSAAAAAAAPRRTVGSPSPSKSKSKVSGVSAQKKRASSNDADGALRKYLKKSPASVASASHTSAARRKQPPEQTATVSQQRTPKRKKQTSTIQLSIGQAFKPPPKNALCSTNLRPAMESSFPLAREYPHVGIAGAMPADHRVTEIQFQREILSVVPQVCQPTRHPLNAQQQRVAEWTPDIPLSIRAGAGSGKTHTMVQRAFYLAKNHGMQPESILMITFSNKAKDELCERIGSVFAGIHPGDAFNIPTIKTFHGLAFGWIRRCWKACGLGKCPSPITTKKQERALMKLAIKEYCDNLRLERCQQILWPDQVGNSSWEMVLEAFRGRYEDSYDLAYTRADEKAKKEMPNEKKKRSMTAEELQALNEEMKADRKLKLRRECYLELLRKKSGKNILNCDLESRWSAETDQCDLYLGLIQKALMGCHNKNDYLRDDANVWDMYDKLQRETGQITFDTMLVLFTEKVLSNEKLEQRFHGMYSHIIVDEYQDNSLEQASMLNKIVTRGSPLEVPLQVILIGSEIFSLKNGKSEFRKKLLLKTTVAVPTFFLSQPFFFKVIEEGILKFYGLQDLQVCQLRLGSSNVQMIKLSILFQL